MKYSKHLETKRKVYMTLLLKSKCDEKVFFFQFWCLFCTICWSHLKQGTGFIFVARWSRLEQDKNMTYIAANKNYDELNLIYTLSLFYYNVYLGLSKSIDKSLDTVQRS